MLESTRVRARLAAALRGDTNLQHRRSRALREPRKRQRVGNTL